MLTGCSTHNFNRQMESGYRKKQQDPSLSCEEKIRDVIDRYFQIQYASLKILKPLNLRFLVTPELDNLVRIAYELHRARRYHLGYGEYEFQIDIKRLRVKDHSARAWIEVSHCVIFQTFPQITSRMKGEQHDIKLVKTGDGWKIAGDMIDDLVTRAARKAGLSLAAYLQLAASWEKIDLGAETPSPILPKVLGYYDRNAAVSYAHRWALSFNPAYDNFTDWGGDCTNFASQVLHAGGIPMDHSGPHQWYYYDLNRRTPSWTGVDELYTYLTNNSFGGGAARLVPLEQVQPGDIIQLDFDPSTWDFNHSPVVVHVGEAGKPAQIFIAAHTINRDNYPLANYSYRALRPLHILGRPPYR